jgi:hypothetical protein
MGAILSRRASGIRLYASYGGDGYRPVGEKEYQSLEGLEVWLTSTQSKVKVTELWKEDERCVLVFARSMG